MSVQKKLAVLDNLGMIHWSRNGRPSYKKYLQTLRGIYRSNLLTDIPPVRGREETKFPTQKSIALLRLPIENSSNEYDLVLDPFCGCAITCVAAEHLKRHWCGIDIAEKAAELPTARLKEGLWTEDFAHFHDMPNRSDINDNDILPLDDVTKGNLHKSQCKYCFVCNDRFPASGMAIEHKIPGKHKGNNHRHNPQLLCTGCNSRKSSLPGAEAITRQSSALALSTGNGKKPRPSGKFVDPSTVATRYYMLIPDFPNLPKGTQVSQSQEINFNLATNDWRKRGQRACGYRIDAGQMDSELTSESTPASSRKDY